MDPLNRTTSLRSGLPDRKIPSVRIVPARIVAARIPRALILVAMLAFGRPQVLHGADQLLVLTTDYSSGSVAQLQVTPPWSGPVDLVPVCADAAFRMYNGLLYVVNRLGCDNVQVIDPSGWSVVRQFSVGSGTNPQDIAFVSQSRAYVSRYETNLLLEVNPSSGAELGTIDLSELADGDGLCEMHRMHIRGNRLFVEIQRLDRRQAPWVPVPPSCLAVIDLDAKQLIDVDPVRPGTQGITLAGTNPDAPIQVDAATGYLLVPEAGAYGVLDNGGIEKVDPAGLRSAGFLVTEAALGGDLVDFALWSPSLAYAVVSLPGFDTVLASFSPATGQRTGIVYDPGSYVLSDCMVYPTGYLFLADRDFFDPGVRVYDARSGALLAGPIPTGLPPFELILRPDPASGTRDAMRGPAGLRGPYPNPSDGQVRLDWEAGVPAPLGLEIYASNGRLVRVLRPEGGQAGRGLTWDGRDTAGRRVPAGSYRLRVLTTDGQVDRRALVRVR